VRWSDLSDAPDNPAVIAAARTVPRGTIRERDGTVLASNKTDANGESYRVYRDRAMSPVLGYASRLFGTAGLERAYDAQLAGLAGADPVADALRKFGRNPYDPQDLQLSISLKLQRAALQGLGSQKGAVVMLDPKTGEVLALASNPTFDANAIANPGTARSAFAALQKDPAQPLLPRATQGRYVPGSVFKIVTAIAGLGSGAITADTTYPQQPGAERNGLLVSGFRVRDGHHPQTDGRALAFEEAVEVSCNVYFALTGLRTGGDALATAAASLGFGAPIPFDLPTAVSQITNGGGRLPGGFKDDVELANAAYGQAETLVTPLQMALVAATVANGGVLMRPRLVTAMTGTGGTRQIGPSAVRDVIDPAKDAVITSAMERAVEGNLGRLFTTGAAVPGVPTAGKSGTAELGGTGEPHSWFIGFAPVTDPKVAIAVIVEQGGRGAARAAPLAGRMMQLALQLLGGGGLPSRSAEARAFGAASGGHWSSASGWPRSRSSSRRCSGSSPSRRSAAGNLSSG
ncbi:MAG TPA: penicillin-binding protein 2, partial [Candidatus Limnocylindrales bacterium]|nr:penicillin-binding protein 2 [Candidatus Limnocylindrales bacterium]